MWTRRQFLVRGVGLGLGAASGALALSGHGGEPVPDGSQLRNMINRAAQEAIDMGLAYLAREQHGDGESFGTNQHRGNVAITSLAGLAFMAGGHQPGRGRYGNAVTRALHFVLDQESPTQRGFLHNRNAVLHGPMYGHGFGALFLAEAHGMVQSRELRERLRGTLERSVQLIINTQNNEGGWRYHPVRQDADISVTICQIMALRAARNAGIGVPKKVADQRTEYVKDCQDKTDGGFRYMKHGGPTGFARTAAGVVALYSAGVYKDDSVKKGLDYLLTRCKPGNPQDGIGRFQRQDMLMHYYYGHYYAVQAMWTAGGRYWTEWYPAIRDELISHADRDRATGAWYDRRICPHYCTAMACIVLQVPNNYLPILQR